MEALWSARPATRVTGSYAAFEGDRGATARPTAGRRAMKCRHRPGLLALTPLAMWLLGRGSGACCERPKATPGLDGRGEVHHHRGQAAVLAQGGPSERRVISGTVTYRQRMALAPGSVVEVWVEGGASGSPATLVGSTRIATTHQVPIPFRVELPAPRAGGQGTYAVSARISGPDGRLLFVSAK